MDGRRPLVLICDDEPALRELIRVTLGEETYRFDEAATVSESVEAARREPPDLVILDLMLPGGSGLDVLRTLRADQALSTTAVVVVSAWSDEANQSAARRDGADAFVGKPFSPDRLVAQVEDLIRRSRSGRPER
jgi:DNA-binding response OmpR family regulator